ncbi:hypothetical protein HOG48_04355 [Candidatus Peregrinibacteria bacterium]|mgnify:CR=1 FL=1|nr:hypothetical protein [Candidatus Peregrinibacteria bacterium]
MQELKSKKASALTIAIIMIPVVLILTGLVIDGGMVFVKKAKLQSIADSAANAGLSMIGDEIVDIVNAKLAANPDYEAPEDILDALDDTDRAALAASASPKNKAEEYIILNNTNDFEFSTQDIEFPYNYSPGDSNISIRIDLSSVHELYFSPMLGIETQELSAESISLIGIQ